MTGKFFLDTNFLLYCFSNDEPDKRNRCLDLLQQAGKRTTAFAISTQVVNEFASVMLSKFKKTPAEVKILVEDLNVFEIVRTDLSVIVEAINIYDQYRFSFWDSLIVSAAKAANCTSIFTEDMQDGQIVAGLTIQSPFTFSI